MVLEGSWPLKNFITILYLTCADQLALTVWWKISPKSQFDTSRFKADTLPAGGGVTLFDYSFTLHAPTAFVLHSHRSEHVALTRKQATP